jgi:hypothetical protein
MYLLSCRHCDAVYDHSKELRETTHATRYAPGYDEQFCPECEESAEDNTEATPEQIKQYQQTTNQETNQ